MVTEDYCGFETAKLLKEKGFEGRMHTFYTEEGTEMESAYVVPSNFFPIYRPTLQMAMKWLREAHNIVFGINPNDHDSVIKWRVEVYKVYEQNGCLLHEGKWIAVAFLPSYEEACEAGIRYCLENLI